MKTFLTYIFFMVILAPCILMFNESDTFVPNIIGVAWLGMLSWASNKYNPYQVYRRIIRVSKQIENITKY